jgi:glycosyltransferase involved in cell wall biosynthesis
MSKDMKRILIFSIAYHPFIGGAEVALKEITDRCGGAAFEFDMITLNLDGKQKPVEKIGNITVHRILGGSKISKLLYPFIAAQYAQKLHKEKKYHAVWSMMANYAGFAELFFKKKNRDVEFLLTLQEGDPIEFILKNVFLVRFWFNQIFTYADRIQTISNYLKNFALTMGANCPVTVIPNGVDITLFTKEIPEEIKNTLLKKYNKKQGDIFLITTSRLVKKNGISDVIQALSFLPENTKFIILGIGELEQDLKLCVRKNGVEDRVIFVGLVSYKDIPSYLAISDVFIRPSLSEGMGNSFIEAMAAKIPVIATMVGGIPDFLHDRKTGLCVKVHDPKDIAEKVNMLVENTELRNNIVHNASVLARESYDWQDIGNRMSGWLQNS